jgi:hypothetical protein
MIDLKTRKDLKVEVQMSRSSNDLFYMRIMDEASDFMIVEVQLNETQFANLMSTRMAEDCKAEYYANPEIGLTQECKSVDVTCENRDLAQSGTEMLYDLAEEDYPGWKADREKYSFRRYDDKNQTYAVFLRRYI